MASPTVEQAEPQGSAAPSQDTSASANGDNGAATPESFGSLYKAHVGNRAQAAASRAGVSSAERESSTPDEQPAASSTAASRPGSAAEDVDGEVVATDSSAATQPKLSRAERKALKTAQPADGTSSETATADTSTASAVDDDPDPVVARVERVEKTVTEGLSRLEGLLKPQTDPGASDQSQGGPDAIYQELFGDDTEFNRRSDIALHGSTKGQYLDGPESDELAVWASNRKAREFTSNRVTSQFQNLFSGMTLSAAEAFGVDAGTVSAPNTTYRDIFSAFVDRGKALSSAELAAVTDRATKAEARAQLLADENEALLKRLPAAGRGVLGGGQGGAVSRGTQLADRSQMTSSQLMRAGLEKQSRGRSERPGSR